MGTTYVYATTQVDAAVSLALDQAGPKTLGAKLLVPSLGPSVKDVKVAELDRLVDTGIYSLDLTLAIEGTFIAALGILLRGHGPGSMIWWRWRAARADVGYWLTDHVSHEVIVNARGRTYRFQVTGQGSVGYDDIAIALVA